MIAGEAPAIERLVGWYENKKQMTTRRPLRQDSSKVGWNLRCSTKCFLVGCKWGCSVRDRRIYNRSSTSYESISSFLDMKVRGEFTLLRSSAPTRRSQARTHASTRSCHLI